MSVTVGFSLLPFIRRRLRQTFSACGAFPEGSQRIRTPNRDVFDAILNSAHADVGGHRLRRNLARDDPRGGRSTARDRSRERQGSLRPERRPAVVSRLRHQAHDRLCDAARGQGGPACPRYATHGFTERGGAIAREDGIRRRHRGHRRQRAQDADGEIGKRHGGRARGGRRRLDRELRRRDERQCAPPRHDQSSFVNPNGLPADDQISSARDLAILARALIRELPEYDYYWHLPGIRMGKMVRWNYNTLIGRYPGADGMKTGFICASGFNLVASATRNGRRLIAVVLGAPSSAARALKAAQLLERGFNSSSGLTWLMQPFSTVESVQPIAAAPPNLRDEMCGGHRKRPASEDED